LKEVLEMQENESVQQVELIEEEYRARVMMKAQNKRE